MADKKNKTTEAVDTASVSQEDVNVSAKVEALQAENLILAEANEALKAENLALTEKLAELESEVTSLNDLVESLNDELDAYTTGDKNSADEFAHIPLRVSYNGKQYTKEEVLKDKKLLQLFKK